MYTLYSRSENVEKIFADFFRKIIRVYSKVIIGNLDPSIRDPLGKTVPDQLKIVYYKQKDRQLKCLGNQRYGFS